MGMTDWEDVEVKLPEVVKLLRWIIPTLLGAGITCGGAMWQFHQMGESIEAGNKQYADMADKQTKLKEQVDRLAHQNEILQKHIIRIETKLKIPPDSADQGYTIFPDQPLAKTLPPAQIGDIPTLVVQR
jgi:hypothetical protein